MHSSGKEKIVDLDFIKTIANGDKGFIIQMIESFINQTPVFLNDMKLHYNNNDWQKLAEVAHKIKPTFKFVGVPEMETYCASLENAIKREFDQNRINTLITEIEKTLNQIIIELKNELKKFK